MNVIESINIKIRKIQTEEKVKVNSGKTKNYPNLTINCIFEVNHNEIAIGALKFPIDFLDKENLSLK